jgi:nitrile hydratase subunit beta
MSYDTHADLGGRDDDRAVRPERDEPRFHAAWEARALALTLAMGACGRWNLDMSRSARETLPEYASSSYYRIWLAALERLLMAQQLVRRDELDAGHALHPATPVARVLAADQVASVLAAGSPTTRPATRPPRFGVGQAVRTGAQRPPHHTRLPGYAMGHVGRIERINGVHVFADANAQGLGEHPQWLYCVVFDGRELFGAQADADSQVAIDAWESYLAPIEDPA